MGEHDRGDPRAVVDEPSLREPRFREEHLVEVGHRDLPVLDAHTGRAGGGSGARAPRRRRPRPLVAVGRPLWAGVVHLRLAGHFYRCLVVTQPRPAWVAQPARRRPLAVGDLADQFRPRVVGHLGVRRRDVVDEWARAGGQPAKCVQELLAVALVESGSHFSCEAEAVGPRDAHEERPETLLAGALSLGPTSDDDVLGLQRLDLYPLRHPTTRPVQGVPAFGDDALEAVGHRCPEHVLPGHVPKGLDRGEVRPSQMQGLQLRPPLVVRAVHERPPVRVEHVEGDERDGVGVGAAPRLPRIADMQPILQAGEAGAPVLSECDDLTVEHDGRHPEELA